MLSPLEITFEGKTAIVTGAARGIGAAIARLFAELGASVALIDEDEEKLSKTATNITEKTGCRSLPLTADVTSFDATENTVNKVIETFGGVQVLVCNAGINRDAAIWKMTEEQWDSVIETNLKGYFNFIRATATAFRKQKYGRIINITSINGMRGKFGQSNYAASKAGIIGLTKTVARELGASQVTVNAIAPGMIVTEMAEKLDQKWLDVAKAETVLDKLGKPEDIAHLTAFLASDLAGHITGQVFAVDGGQYM
jgi:3-oxoacyl-[acyl-carrier protein] reductase